VKKINELMYIIQNNPWEIAIHIGKKQVLLSQEWVQAVINLLS
jgi:Txe/YoeB family toxin of Txe-Axe toxin-antitoxin module